MKRVPSRPTRCDAVGEQRIGGRVGDVDERHADPRGDRVGDDVHGVGGEADDAGALRLEAGRDVAEDDAGLVPALGALQLLDRREVDRVEDDRRRVQAAEAARGLLVEDAVVVGASIPSSCRR